jgi:hypothetical protein
MTIKILFNYSTLKADSIFLFQQHVLIMFYNALGLVERQVLYLPTGISWRLASCEPAATPGIKRE